MTKLMKWCKAHSTAPKLIKVSDQVMLMQSYKIFT